RRPGGQHRFDRAAVAEVDAVERAERDGARLPLELRDRAGDLHVGITTRPTATSSPLHSVRTSARARRRPVRIAAAPSASTSTAGRNGSASAGGTSRSSSASATENGPPSSRRRVRQCPPSASAIERTYV